MQRVRRNVVPSLASADMEGSGDDTPLFNGTGITVEYPIILHYLKHTFMNHYHEAITSSCSVSLLLCAEACKAAPDTGPCFGMHQRYFYNSSSMSCELFQYGGCMGNQNNFENERECLQRCRTEGKDGHMSYNIHARVIFLIWLIFQSLLVQCSLLWFKYLFSL